MWLVGDDASKLQVAEAQGSRRRVPVAPKGSPLMSGWY